MLQKNIEYIIEVTTSVVVALFVYILWPMNVNGALFFDGTDVNKHQILVIPGIYIKTIIVAVIIAYVIYLKRVRKTIDQRSQRSQENFLLKHVDAVSISGLRIALVVVLISTATYLILGIRDHFIVIPERCGANEEQRLQICSDQQGTSKNEGIVQTDGNLGTGGIRGTQTINVNSGNPNSGSDGNRVASGDLLQMLSLLAVFGAVLAYVFNEIISEKIKKASKIDHKQLQRYVTAKLMNGDGVIHYFEYDKLSKKINKCPVGDPRILEHEEEQKISIDRAYALFTTAHEQAMELFFEDQETKDGIDRNMEYELLFCTIKNNVAWTIYHKIKCGFVDNKDRIPLARMAFSYIDFALEKADRHPEKNRKSWVDTQRKLRDLFSKKERDEIRHKWH